MANKTPLERINEIKAAAQAEIEKLTAEALTELQDKRKAALQTLQGIEDAIAELTGKKTRKRGGGSSKPNAGHPDVPSASSLKALLKAAPEKTLNRAGINAAGYNLKSAIELAKADDKTFSYTQNKAQGTVTLN